MSNSSAGLSTAPILKCSVDIPPAVARQAVEWLMEWQSSDDPHSVWQSILCWRQANSSHEQAWQQIEAVNKKLGALAELGAGAVHGTLTKPAMSRREALKMLSVLVGVGGSGLLAYHQQPWRTDYRTGVGQQLLTLADGTQVTLNSYSAIDVNYTTTERRVTLRRGELYIRTGKSGNGPFILDTAQGELQPLGTRFSVRQRESDCRVAVYEGRVQVRPMHRQQFIVVDTGYALDFTKTQWSVRQPVDEAEAAWTQGMMVVSNMALSDFLAELNRHRTGIIYCDPAVAHLKVSGTYPLNQTSEVLHALSATLPVRLQTLSRFWVRVLPVAS